jgi:hypothetical protein
MRPPRSESRAPSEESIVTLVFGKISLLSALSWTEKLMTLTLEGGTTP